MLTAPSDHPERIGRYTIVRRLGKGGMGVVYVAHDERLGRDIALKMISGSVDDSAVKRFWREARAAASVSHPNVCQVYEVDESPYGVFIAMELLEGESLEQRLAKGSCSPAESVRIALEVLAALGALHDRGFVHRDVKPSNVFLTPHGAKLLDFGLARTASDDTVKIGGPNASDITQPGMIVGTPRYMSPEQVLGQPVDARTDLYAVGAVVFQMLAGRPPFVSDNVLDVIHMVLHENPPALQGSPAVVAVDRVIRRSLSKDPAGRHASAAEMADELRRAPADTSGTVAATPVRALTRLLVPPLHLARPDAEAAFLSSSLAEAISTTLAGLKEVVVRSPTVASTWDRTDPRKLAADADVDILILGSLTRVDDQLRAQLQLVDGSSGTVRGASSIRGTMSDIFAFEDQLTRSVVALLHPDDAAGPAAAEARRDVPANSKAFESFLRGLEFSHHLEHVVDAREAFQRAVDEDPSFAPAWAGLGRMHRVIGKFFEDRLVNERRAEDAFRHALALSPDQPMAHRYMTHLESEQGRADAAIARLLEYARRNRNDAQLFAGLVHACRYSGLLDESVAAHQEARRLDPTVSTSVEYTLIMRGEYDRLVAMSSEHAPDVAAIFYGRALRGDSLTRQDMEGQFVLDRMPSAYRKTVHALLMTIVETDAEALKAAEHAAADVTDPEALFVIGMILARRFGDHMLTFRLLEAGVRGGLTPLWTLRESPSLANVRSAPAFQTLITIAEQRNRVATAVFERGGGRELLGLSRGT